MRRFCKAMNGVSRRQRNHGTDVHVGAEWRLCALAHACRQWGLVQKQKHDAISYEPLRSQKWGCAHGRQNDDPTAQPSKRPLISFADTEIQESGTANSIVYVGAEYP